VEVVVKDHRELARAAGLRVTAPRLAVFLPGSLALFDRLGACDDDRRGQPAGGVRNAEGRPYLLLQ
jgi:hypothetical protein